MRLDARQINRLICHEAGACLKLQAAFQQAGGPLEAYSAIADTDNVQLTLPHSKQ